MVVIADPTPLVMKDVTLIIGVDDFKAHVSGVEFVPSSSRVTWKGLAGNTYAEATAPTWDLRVAYAQDWDMPASLSRYLLDNAGQSKAITFKPRSGAGPSFTTNAVLVPGPIGGNVDAPAASTVTLGCDGPTLVPPV